MLSPYGILHYLFFALAGFDIGKKSRTHWMALNKNKMEHVDYYECIVRDDRERVGFNRFSTKPVVKEKINVSQGTSLSAGISFKFFRNYTKLTMFSTLYCFVVKGKLIAKSLAPLGVVHQHLRIFIPMPIHLW